MSLESAIEKLAAAIDRLATAISGDHSSAADMPALSIRTTNALAAAGLSVSDLTAMTEGDVLRWKNIGHKQLNEIKDALQKLGLSLKPTPPVE